MLRKRKAVGGAKSESRQSLHVGWASAESGAASNMIRALRRRAFGIELLRPEIRPKPSEWSVTNASLETWRQRPTWLPAPSALGPLHDDIRREAETTVANLFRVLQGIRTGAIGVFLISPQDYSKLPRRERQFFAAAVDNASFLEGHIEPKRFLFIGDPAWERETDVSQQCLHISTDSCGQRKRSFNPARVFRALTHGGSSHASVAGHLTVGPASYRSDSAFSQPSPGT